jgi:phosphatidate phosphatase APP1
MFKHRVFILLAVLVLQTSAFAGAPDHSVALITGFDDVLREARNQGALPSLEQFFHHDETFAGMSELYAEITANEPGPVKLNLISGFPSFGKHRVARFLETAHYPHAHLILRNWLRDRSLEDFKIQNVSKILRASPDRPFVVVFDNSQPSLTMATRLLSSFPTQLTGFYLHEVIHRNEAPVPGTELYLTAYDIAKREWTQGHLSSTQAARVAKAIVDEPNSERVIPYYAYCPKDYHPCDGLADLDPQSSVCQQLEDRIGTICGARR